MLDEIIQMVKQIVGNEYLYFDNALEIKKTPHTQSFTAWAVCVSPDDVLYVMDNEEDWFPVCERDILLIPSLFQRIKIISEKYKVA